MAARTIKSLFDLTGKTALITGGSRGLGYQMAQSLGEAGAKIMLSSRKAEDLNKAAESLKLTAEDGIKLKIVDGIIKEPLGGAHSDREGTFKEVEKVILDTYNSLKDLNDADLVMQRMDKYSTMGVYKE